MMHVNDESFQKEVLDEKILPVFVDFWATWCGPCQMVGPIIEELDKEYNGKLKFIKVDVDQAQNTASKYGIMSVPTFMIFKNGEVVKQFMGAMSKEGFKEEIEGILK